MSRLRTGIFPCDQMQVFADASAVESSASRRVSMSSAWRRVGFLVRARQVATMSFLSRATRI